MYKETSKYLEHESFRQSAHKGIDFQMSDHTPLRSIKDGTVEKILDFGNQNAGKCIKIKFEDGNTGIYGHLSEFANIKEGQHVNAGDLIGYSGNSGNVVGANGGYHLHFGVRDVNGNFIDPSPYVNDIQHMNDVGYFANQIAQHTPNVKLNFFDYMEQHMNTLPELKLQLINLPYDTLLIQISKQILQFISIHASFLNHIITCIF
jgi:murein DD-endopeptidase MepM/ murein hydrolase activator NlpD